MRTAAPPPAHLRTPRGGWALPPRPPEDWVSPVWSVVLTLLLGTAVVVPLTAVLRADPHTREVAAAAGLAVVLAAAAAVLAHALLVQGTVSGDRRLSWTALAPLLLHPVVLVLVLALGAGAPRSVLLLHGLVPVLTLSSPLARRLPAVGAAALGLGLLAAVAGVALLVSGMPPGMLGPVGVGGVLLCLLALAVWLRFSPGGSPWGWVALQLALSAVAVAGVPLGAGGAATAVLAVLPLLVPALGLGLRSATGYVVQARRWRALEQEVRDSRIPTALLPGRSVSPEDDEGLPLPEEVEAVLAHEAVLVALQPVLRLTDEVVVGQEALARFGGRIPTDRWFRGASRYGLGLDLEVLCLRQALALLPDVPADQFLAVNLSPAALVTPSTLVALQDADLSRVVVEVTEHEAVADYPAVRATLDRLRDRGARIAVDDTGAGYASLRHVLLLQPEVVKLDTALVHDLRSDPRKRALVVALTTFAQEVGSTVLAEGIETDGQLQELREIGVDLGQGWHLGVPMLPGEEPLRR